MAIERFEARWLTEERRLSLGELADLSGLAETELRELVEYGAIAPAEPGAKQWTFAASALTTARTACRLRASFDLEPHAVSLVLSLLERIRALEHRIASLRARMPGDEF